MQGNPGQSWILDSTRWILDFRYWVPVFFFGTWIPDSNRYGPINVKPARGGGGAGVEGRAWSGDLTFFKKLPSNSLPTGRSFRSIATNFRHPGVTLLSIPRLDPRKAQQEYLQIKLCNLYL